MRVNQAGQHDLLADVQDVASVAGFHIFEAADARHVKVEFPGAKTRKGVSEVVCDWALHLADESQREMQLFLFLPAEIRAVVHGVDCRI